MTKTDNPGPKPRLTRKKRSSEDVSGAAPQMNQGDKFIQAAREAECDETGEALDEALRAIGRAGKK